MQTVLQKPEKILNKPLVKNFLILNGFSLVLYYCNHSSSEVKKISKASAGKKILF
jgi:hypothetical protein